MNIYYTARVRSIYFDNTNHKDTDAFMQKANTRAGESGFAIDFNDSWLNFSHRGGCKMLHTFTPGVSFCRGGDYKTFSLINEL